jgi:hypothetical protein
MPFTAPQIAAAVKAAIDYFLKNDPIDQINTERPLLKKLMGGKKEYAGGLQYVVEQLRKSNDSNFQAYFTNDTVTYNTKQTLEQAKWTWGSFHDGFMLDEDTLAQNGITMTDDRTATPSDAEKVQLTNLLKENMETLKIGFQEKFDIMLHRNGTADPQEIPGLDALISTTPGAVGVVGGLDQVANTWWRNYANVAIPDPSDDVRALPLVMEAAWRSCIRAGGSTPDFILAGTQFCDAYRACATDGDGGIDRTVVLGGNNGVSQASKLDLSVGAGVSTGLFFKGLEIIWDPVMSVVDALDAPAVPWERRCYFINSRFLSLRPIKGHWMVSRKPPRTPDKYVHYFALTSKAALTTGKRNAHAVLGLAAPVP